ncbi:uncharacterized protein P884DRAFT_254012, partial [Thermothelomyces heterothallicus CBS 202.75]|uniref:uncharacterized protein n=1 Tax=Thermothelomyces heterothallicus CBS 202.75 TaxID=1149848 RepID=UPI0037447BA0
MIRRLSRSEYNLCHMVLKIYVLCIPRTVAAAHTLVCRWSFLILQAMKLPGTLTCIYLLYLMQTRTFLEAR